jgi:hypothetical protein
MCKCNRYGENVIVTVKYVHRFIAGIIERPHWHKICKCDWWDKRGGSGVTNRQHDTNLNFSYNLPLLINTVNSLLINRNLICMCVMHGLICMSLILTR